VKKNLKTFKEKKNIVVRFKREEKKESDGTYFIISY